MKIVADTNVLIRALLDDDLEQSAIARAELEQAELVVLTTAALCELVWVLSRSYRLPTASIAEAPRRLVESENVLTDPGAFDAGIAHLEAGGDFADGAIAYEGRRMGASTFVSFDRKAARLLDSQGDWPARCSRVGQARANEHTDIPAVTERARLRHRSKQATPLSFRL